MPVRQDITGNVYGRLTAREYVGKTKGGARLWHCDCSCGGSATSSVSGLNSGNSTSCGCTRKEKTIERSTTHGQTSSAEYGPWNAAKRRCGDPNNKHYKDYGGRGIVMDPQWVESFEKFREDMGPRPGPEYSIERKDHDGDYEPSNCHWATLVEQSRNRRNNRIVDVDGRVITLAALAEEAGVNYDKLKYRLNKGLPLKTLLRN